MAQIIVDEIMKGLRDLLENSIVYLIDCSRNSSGMPELVARVRGIFKQDKSMDLHCIVG